MKRYIFPVFVLSVFMVVAHAAFFNAPFATHIARAQTTPASCMALTANLSLGSRGASVSELQSFLHANGFLSAAPSGYYGALTAAAVKNFQSRVGLPAVAIVGPMTRAFLQKNTCTSALTGPTPLMATSTPTTTTPALPATTTVAMRSTAILPYNSQDFSNWEAAWGDVSTTSTGALHLQGSLTNNGAEAIYPASNDWTDYRYQADVSVANGNISLLGRYVDSNNFMTCSFSKNWVEMGQVYNGTSTVLVSKVVDGILPGTDGLTKTTSVTMNIKGNTIGCSGYGPTDNITYTLPAGSALKGGIGIASWYETPLADKLDLLSVKADPI